MVPDSTFGRRSGSLRCVCSGSVPWSRPGIRARRRKRNAVRIDRAVAIGMALLANAGVLLSPWRATAAGPAPAGEESRPAAESTLEETRLMMDKWIDTQQIISKERKDWQQGKDLLLARLELIDAEIATLEEQIAEA